MLLGLAVDCSAVATAAAVGGAPSHRQTQLPPLGSLRSCTMLIRDPLAVPMYTCVQDDQHAFVDCMHIEREKVTREQNAYCGCGGWAAARYTKSAVAACIHT